MMSRMSGGQGCTGLQADELYACRHLWAVGYVGLKEPGVVFFYRMLESRRSSSSRGCWRAGGRLLLQDAGEALWGYHLISGETWD